MPGPIIADQRPDWLKPENASVFDSGLTRAMRAIADAFGVNDPASQMMGVASPLMTLAPRQEAAALVEKFAPVENVTPAFREAIEYLARRFPRLMSHVDTVVPSPLARGGEVQTIARMEPEFPARMPRMARDLKRPVASIRYDPAAIQGQELDTLAHELTHVAQTVRQTDLAGRIPTEPTFHELYGRMKQAQGYTNHPMEIAARRNGANEVAKRSAEGLKASVRHVAQMVWDEHRDPAIVERRIRQIFSTLPDTEVAKVVQAVQAK
jgi:hypothetical protein